MKPEWNFAHEVIQLRELILVQFFILDIIIQKVFAFGL